jgi:hypothetical protein
MNDFQTYSTFVEMCFWINTIFGIYANITQRISHYLRIGIEASVRLSKRDIDETKLQDVYNYFSSCKHLQLVLSKLFRVISALVALVCLFIIYEGLFPAWIPSQNRWVLLAPIPSYLIVAVLLLIYQMLKAQIVLWRSSSKDAFKLPDVLEDK